MSLVPSLVQEPVPGGRLHPNTAVVDVHEQGDGVRVNLANGHRVMASYAVVATNSPIHQTVGFHSKQTPYRTYAMAFDLQHGQVEDQLYWDTLDPYHYVRLTSGPNGRDRLIVGGEDHKSGEADNALSRFVALDAWIRMLVPTLGEETHRWSGQVMDTLDYGAFIGLDPDYKRIYFCIECMIRQRPWPTPWRDRVFRDVPIWPQPAPTGRSSLGIPKDA